MILLSQQGPSQSLVNSGYSIAVIYGNFPIIVGLFQINIFKLSVVFKDHANHLNVILMNCKMQGCVTETAAFFIDVEMKLHESSVKIDCKS
jgi:hypothetical protein